jgi:signal peptidase I
MKDSTISPAGIILTALLIFILLKLFVFDIMVVQGHSMEPTLRPGEFIIVSRCAYGLLIPFVNRYIVTWAYPRRDDLVVFISPENEKIIVKRCVAIGGDFFDISNEYLSVGERQYPYQHPDGIAETFIHTVVPDNTILVLGDNPPQSVDSRMFGFVPLSRVIGSVMCFL